MLVTTVHTALPAHTTFLYPKSRQYPFDEVCEKIVRALEGKNWKIPGIEVEFCDMSSGEMKWRHVSEIKGEDFRLIFCRVQGSINQQRNDIAAINKLLIPKRELRVYEDESGPVYITYIGDNWNGDKQSFMESFKLNSKIDGKPKTYLRYRGRIDPDSQSSFVRARNPYLGNVNDFGNEYSAEGDEPKFFQTSQVFQEFNEWLIANVLERIEAEKTCNTEPTTERVLPYPAELGPVYLRIDRKARDRIIQGKKDKSKLAPADRYALIGGGKRLVSLNVPKDGTVPKEASEGFAYCYFKMPVVKEEDDDYVLRINPSNAKDLFIADFAPGNKYRQQCFEQSKKTFLTNEEYNETERCTGRTIVPIHQYKGNYEKPMMLIGPSRELSFDEVEIV